MALSSKCGACGNVYFEIKEVSPAGARYKLFFVQCKKCGVPAGVQDYFNIGSLLTDQEKKIKDIEKRVRRVEQIAVNIDNNVARLADQLLRR